MVLGSALKVYYPLLQRAVLAYFKYRHPTPFMLHPNYAKLTSKLPCITLIAVL